MDSSGPKEACIRWGLGPRAKGQFLGERTFPACPRTLAWAVQNGWTDWDAVLVEDSGGRKEALCYMGTHLRNLANTTEPSVCGSDAAVKLLWPLVLALASTDLLRPETNHLVRNLTQHTGNVRYGMYEARLSIKHEYWVWRQDAWWDDSERVEKHWHGWLCY